MNYFNTSDAATSQGCDRIALKKSVNTKVNRNINFLLGLILALLTVYLIIELNSQVVNKKIPIVSIKQLEPEQNVGPYRILVEKKPQQQKKVQKKQQPLKKQKKFDISKAPVIDETVDDFDDLLAALEPTNDPIAEPVDHLKSGDGPADKNSEPATSHVNFVSEVPLFPGCSSSMDRAERIDCLNSKMARFVQRKFDTSMANETRGSNTVRISVMFTIGIDGLPMNIQIKAPSEKLKKEAARVISKLPQMTPGKMNGEPVNVTYTLPIVYKVN
ncbi:MAG: energy transducer TonB [Nonlabens sp.]